MAKVLVYPGDTLAALVAEARWKELERVEEPPTLLDWLEQEIREAEEEAFRAKLRREDPAGWEGYASALRDVLRAIQRREVRA